MVAFMRLRLLICLFVLSMPGFSEATEVQLNPDHPEHYTVTEGDTLWDIASKFLANPWQWTEIWQENPHIENPHWIYPGDELVLNIADGKPRLQVTRRFQNAPHSFESRPNEVKLVPTIRQTPLQQGIPTIPLNAIQQFLMQTNVVGRGEMDSAPYVVDFADEHISGGAGDRIYVRGISENPLLGYMVFRAGPSYKDAETHEILGYEALYVADVEFQTLGDPSTLLITKSNRDVRIGDRILAGAREQLQMDFQPHPPSTPIKGHIISVVDGVSQIGQYSIVVIDRGKADGLEIGHVLEIRKSRKAIIYMTNYLMTDSHETINIPDEREGLLIIFHSYERVSFGVVLNAIRAIQLNDAVENPR